MDQIQYLVSDIVPEGSRQADSATFAQDANIATATYLISDPKNNLLPVINYILGTSKVVQKSVGTPNTFSLSRTVPARHPYFKWLRATRITGIMGKGGPSSSLSFRAAPTLITGTWKKVNLTVQFEQTYFPDAS